MGIDQTTIDEIVRRVTRVVPAEKIIVFGSAATGGAGDQHLRMRTMRPKRALS